MLDAIEKVMGRRPSICGSGEPLSEEDYNKLVWQIGIDANHMSVFGEPEDKPQWEDVKKAMDKLEAEYATFEYQRNRKPEYPSLEECIHAILDDKLEELQAKRKAVKDKYPKPVVKEPKPELPNGN